MNTNVSPRNLSQLLWILILITLNACQTESPPVDLMVLAVEQRSQGAYTAAENLYTQLLYEDAGPAPALALADLYLEWQRPASGLAALGKAVTRGITAGEMITHQMSLLLLDRRWQPAADVAQNHLNNDPGNNLALQTLITASLQLHRCSEARDTALRLQQVNPEDTETALTAGILGENPSLICASKPALCPETTGCDGLCRLDIGHYLIEHNAWGLASCILERAIELDPGNASAHIWLGESLSRLDQPITAEEHFRTAVALDPDNPLGWLLLGGHTLKQGDWETARAALLNAQQLDTGNPAPCLTIAELKAAQSLYEEVDTWIKAALQRAPNDSEVWKAAARIYLTRNLVQSDMPRWIADSAVALDPQDAEAHLLLGWVYLAKGNADSAAIEIDSAIELDPTLGQAHYIHGLILEKTGEPEEAQAAFTRAADLGHFP